MDWLFHAFWLAVGILGGFMLGAYAVTKEADRQKQFWRDKALDLQARVHELEGTMKWNGE